jgi:NhaP-type Na+/H+ and K+/H+ antiporter
LGGVQIAFSSQTFLVVVDKLKMESMQWMLREQKEKKVAKLAV